MPFTRARSYKMGFRPDIGITVRSRWEANIARYLAWLSDGGVIKGWAYEPLRFWFEGIRSGTRSYLPDFRVDYPDGHHEWIEVKGYWDPKSKTSVKRFRKYFPEETLVIIDKPEYLRLEKDLKERIPNWESA